MRGAASHGGQLSKSGYGLALLAALLATQLIGCSSNIAQTSHDLHQSAQRTASIAPPKAAVADLACTLSGGIAELTWTYRNPGDLDQNSEVNIADITTLGAHLGKKPSSPDWQRAQVADADGNGEVNISDLTTVGANLGDRVDSYVVQSSPTPTVPSSWVDAATVQFAISTIPTGGGFRTFSTQVPHVTGNSYQVLAVTASQRGAVSNVVSPVEDVVQGISATQGTLKDQVTVSWQALAGADTYDVEQANAQIGPFAPAGSTAATALTQVGAPGIHKWYHVIAVSSGQPGPPSAAVEGWAMEPPGAPQQLAASDGSFDDRISLSWLPVATATQYHIWREQGASGFSEVGSTSATIWDDTTATPALIYTYHVVAENGEGLGAPSATDDGYRASGGLPKVIAILPGTGSLLQLFMADPLIRRDPALNIDLAGNTVTPADANAYGDVLRTSGLEFDVQAYLAQAYPRLTLIAGADPSAISPATPGIPGVVVTERSGARLAVDVSGLAPGQYCLKLFAHDDTPEAEGTFTLTGAAPDAPVGISWGINAFNRAAGPLSGAGYILKTTHGDVAASSTPEVAWLEIAGGTFSMADPGSNVQVLLADTQTPSQQASWPLRVVAVSGESRYLCVHPIAVTDFHGHSGILERGENYSLGLDDPATPGVEFTYPDAMLVASDPLP